MNVRTTRLPTIIITAIVTALIIGGGVYRWQHAKVQFLTAQLESLTGEISKGRAASHTIELEQSGRVEGLKQRVGELEAEARLLREYPADAGIPPDLLAVYGSTGGVSSETMVVHYYVPANRRQPVIQKMRILADRVSRFSFDSLPITVTGIKTLKGKSVATIDLRETGWKTGPSWFGGVFEGSSGGAITQETLVRTFLQKGYSGEWVDGIRFTYEGKPDPAGDHVDLSGVFYR